MLLKVGFGNQLIASVKLDDLKELQKRQEDRQRSTFVKPIKSAFDQRELKLRIEAPDFSCMDYDKKLQQLDYCSALLDLNDKNYSEQIQRLILASQKERKKYSDNDSLIFDSVRAARAAMQDEQFPPPPVLRQVESEVNGSELFQSEMIDGMLDGDLIQLLDNVEKELQQTCTVEKLKEVQLLLSTKDPKLIAQHIKSYP